VERIERELAAASELARLAGHIDDEVCHHQVVMFQMLSQSFQAHHQVVPDMSFNGPLPAPTLTPARSPTL